LKPSEHTPKTSAWLAERLAAELPEGLVSVLVGDGRAGASLSDAGIDACVFTGSPRTGQKVRVQCAERGIPSSIEMGGKDPAIVLADCDQARTAAGVTHWALSNVGQACGAIEVMFVDRRIADALLLRLRRAWTKLRVGTDASADIGPLGNLRQFEIVKAHVADARAKGAEVVCGGAPTGQGLCFAPTILDHCDDGMQVTEDETFGPVLAVVRVDGADDAIRRANRSRYGLGASICTSDVARARRLGVANGPESLLTFVRPRATIVDESGAPEPFFLPYDRALSDLGDILADAQLGRFAHIWRVPLLLRKRLRTVRDFFA
jgi:acyl-CoA reductase-like NAD-dependent aldehyde dehydrogenase